MKERRVKHKQHAMSGSWLVGGPLVLVFVVSVCWAIFSVLPLVPALLTAYEIDNYRPAQFVVDEVVYRRHRRGADRYYAKGRIDGVPEVFELYDVAPILETREALEKHFGQQPVTFDVMYNPNRMRAMQDPNRMQPKQEDGSTRVLPAREVFAESYRNAAWWALFNTLGSMAVAVIVLVVFLVMSHKRKKR